MAPDTEQSRSEQHSGVLAELAATQEELRAAQQELIEYQRHLNRLHTSQLRQQRTRHGFVTRMMAPALITDPAGTIVLSNTAAASLLGIPAHRLAGKPILSFVEASERTALRRSIEHAVESQQSHVETRAHLLVSGGDPVEVDVVATLEHNEDPFVGTEVTWVLLEDGRASDLGRVDPGLARALVELSRVPLTSSDTEELTRHVVRLCQAAMPVPLRVSVTLGDPLTPEVVATDSPEAQALDGAQLMAGEGPCLEAYRLLTSVWTSDMGVDERWPRLGRHLAGEARAAVVATPVIADGKATGVLNLYLPGDSRDTTEVVQAAELVASTVATVLQEVSLRSELETAVSQLHAALESRATIDQAKGVVMARYGCDPDEAFRILAKLSSNANMKVREIAARLVQEAAAGRSS